MIHYPRSGDKKKNSIKQYLYRLLDILRKTRSLSIVDITAKERDHERRISFTLRFDLATGKMNLNKIVYKNKELQNPPLMLWILEKFRAVRVYE